MAEDAPTVPVPGPDPEVRIRGLMERLRAAEGDLVDATAYLTGDAAELAAQGAQRVRATRRALESVLADPLHDTGAGPSLAHAAELRAAAWVPVDVVLLGTPRLWRDPASERVMPWTRALDLCRRDRAREGGHGATVGPTGGEDQSA